MSLAQWKSPDKWTWQDRLLLSYWRQVGGTVFTEVQVGQSGRRQWPAGTKSRWIDGVRIVPTRPDSTETDIITYDRAVHADRFAEAVKNAIVEVIEVDDSLGRYVIGQALVGSDILALEYEPNTICPVVVCAVGDPLMEMVCRRRGINVVVLTP